MRLYRKGYVLRFLLEILRDAPAFEGVHLIDHSDGGVDNRIGADGAGTLAEPHAEVEQGARMEGVKDELMARFAAAVSEDGVCHHVWAERTGGQHAVGEDESVDKDEHTQFGCL